MSLSGILKETHGKDIGHNSLCRPMFLPAQGLQLLVLFSRYKGFELAHLESEEIAKPGFWSWPSVEYKLPKNRDQTRRLSWPQAPEGGNISLWPEWVRDTVSFRCWDLKPSKGPDSTMLMGQVDSPLPVLCAPFFASCEAMEFAETGQRREECQDLPVSFW